MSINAIDQRVKDAVELGRQAIHKAEKYGNNVHPSWSKGSVTPWDKKDRDYKSSGGGLSCCICCVHLEGKSGLALVVVSTVLGFFYALYNTFKALSKATELKDSQIKAAHLTQQLTDVKNSVSSSNPPPINPMYYAQNSMPPMGGPAVGSTSGHFVPFQGLSAQADSAIKIILQKSEQVFAAVRKERLLASLSHAIITIGAGLLSAALLTILVTEAHFILIAVAATGAAVIVVGAVTYGLKYALLSWQSTRDNCQDIASQISGLHGENVIW